MAAERSPRRRTAVAFAVLMAGAGALHFLVPGPYRRIVPHALGHEAAIVAISGVAEVACALALVTPATRRAGGWLTAALLVAVFPANVQMAIDAGLPRTVWSGATLSWLRLPIQVPLVWWAVGIGRHAHHHPAVSDPPRSVPTAR